MAPELKYADSALGAAAGADALVVATAWAEFAATSAADAAETANRPVVIDICQGIDAGTWRNAGWEVSSLVTELGFPGYPWTGPLRTVLRAPERWRMSFSRQNSRGGSLGSSGARRACSTVAKWRDDRSV